MYSEFDNTRRWLDTDGNPIQAHGGSILQHNDIRSITVVRMEVPCCGGLTAMVKKAVAASGKNIPLRIQVLSIDGELLE